MFRYQLIQRNGGLGSALKLGLFAFGGYIVFFLELTDFRSDLFVGHRLTKIKELTHFHDFKVVAKDSSLLGQVAIDIKHTAIVVAQYANPVFAHSRQDLSRIHPILDFLPGRFLLRYPVTT